MTGDAWFAAGLSGLFASAFTSATLLPGTSEAVLASMLAAGTTSVGLLVAVASLGNVLGSCVNWWLGRRAADLADMATDEKATRRLERARSWYARYGRWSLLGAWLPIIGDPLTLVAGLMREPFVSFAIIVSIAKTGRYIAIASAMGLLT